MKTAFGLLMSAAAFVMLLSTFVLPWYHVVNRGSSEDGFVYEDTFYLRDWSFNIYNTEVHYQYDDPATWEPVRGVMLVELALVLSAVGFLGFSLSSLFLGRRIATIGSGALSALLMFFAAAYFFVSITGALNDSIGTLVTFEGFVGEGRNELNIYHSWGPLIGWYLLLTAMVAQTTGVILVDLGRKGY